MYITKGMRLAVLVLGFGLCPSLFAVSYTWDFTGSAGSNCSVTSGANSCSNNIGNSMTFASTTPGGPTVKATAWYLNSSGTFQKATLGQYSAGLGVCYPGENCSQPEHQVDNNAYDEFVLFEFSKPVDPSTVTLTSTSGGDMDVSYWLGGNAVQSLNLKNLTSSLNGLGFGSINNTNGTATGTRVVDLSGGTPSGYVNAILFGPKYTDGNDYFKITSMTGSTGVSAVPEPSSVILLFTVALLGFKLNRSARQPRNLIR
jgi:hypothetical protein